MGEAVGGSTHMHLSNAGEVKLPPRRLISCHLLASPPTLLSSAHVWVSCKNSVLPDVEMGNLRNLITVQ